jgi:hypothetical protein
LSISPFVDLGRFSESRFCESNRDINRLAFTAELDRCIGKRRVRRPIDLNQKSLCPGRQMFGSLILPPSLAPPASNDEAELSEAEEEVRAIVRCSQDNKLWALQILLELGMYEVRDLARIWKCNPRTVQRRFAKLAAMWREREASRPLRDQQLPAADGLQTKAPMPSSGGDDRRLTRHSHARLPP